MHSNAQRLLASIRGRKRYAYLREYEGLQWLSRERLLDLQFMRLKQLLVHAYVTTTYYRDIFQEAGCRPDDIRTCQDLAHLPILTKKLVKENANEMISSSFLKKNLRANTSGGSTGEPLSFYQDEDVFEQMYANQMLALKMAGWSGSERIVHLWGNPKESKKGSMTQRIREALTKMTILNAYSYNESVIKNWINVIQNKRHTYLYGYVSVLTDVAEYILNNKIDISNVQGVMTSAEQLLSWQREMIEKGFRCKVYDQYGSREIPAISCECKMGGMHLLTNSAYVEFLSDVNKPENMKKIIVTSLSNFSMPFIRYEIGDYAAPKDGKCACGRGFPLMEMQIGRMTDRFVTPDGNKIYGTFFVRQMYGIDGVKNFQFRQTDPRHVFLYVVRGNQFCDSDIEKIGNVEGKIRKETGWNGLILNVEYVEEIPKTMGGKHRHVVCEVE